MKLLLSVLIVAILATTASAQHTFNPYAFANAPVPPLYTVPSYVQPDIIEMQLAQSLIPRYYITPIRPYRYIPTYNRGYHGYQRGYVPSRYRRYRTY